MIDPASFFLFLAAVLALNVTPGPDMMFVAGNGLAGGPRAGIAAALGVSGGCLVHVALAAGGVSALLAAEPLAFDALRIAGALYLLWCAWKAWRSPPLALAPAAERRPLAVVFRQGVLTNALNPKVGLFFLAFLPQFVPAGSAHPGLLTLVLGLVVVASSTVVNGAVGAGTGGLGQMLGRKPAIATWLGRLCATIYVGLALRLLLSGRSS